MTLHLFNIYLCTHLTKRYRVAKDEYEMLDIIFKAEENLSCVNSIVQNSNVGFYFNPICHSVVLIFIVFYIDVYYWSEQIDFLWKTRFESKWNIF